MLKFKIGDTQFKVIGDKLIVSRGTDIEVTFNCPVTTGGLAIQCNALAKLSDEKLKELPLHLRIVGTIKRL